MYWNMLFGLEQFLVMRPPPFPPKVLLYTLHEGSPGIKLKRMMRERAPGEGAGGRFTHTSTSSRVESPSVAFLFSLGLLALCAVRSAHDISKRCQPSNSSAAVAVPA